MATLILFHPTDFLFSIFPETRVKEEETEETPEEVEIEVDLTEDSHDVRVPASSKVICQVWPLTYFHFQFFVR